MVTKHTLRNVENIVTVTTPTEVAGFVNDWSISNMSDGSLFVVNIPTNDADVTGIAGGVDGQKITFVIGDTEGGGFMAFKGSATESVLANRFSIVAYNGNPRIILGIGGSITFVYSAAVLAAGSPPWVMLSANGTSSP